MENLLFLGFLGDFMEVFLGLEMYWVVSYEDNHFKNLTFINDCVLCISLFLSLSLLH
jgi:hypothetical protein